MSTPKTPMERCEKWRPIPCCPGYLVSESGLVQSPRYHIPLKGTVTPKGYVAVSVMLSGKPKIFRAHRLVATAFLGMAPSSKHQVNHKDGNKLNNHVSNLEWVTSQENVTHSINVLGNVVRGEMVKTSSLDLFQVLAIKTLLNHPEWTNRRLADAYGVHITSVNKIRKGKSWAHV